MRKLLNTLYISSADLYLRLENDNVIVQREQEELERIPLHTLESIVSFTRTGISVPLISSCSKHGIPIFLMSDKGNLLAEISVPSQGNILLRKEQYRMTDKPEKAVRFASAFIQGKIRNQRHIIDRFIWEHNPETNLSSVSTELDNTAKRITDITDIDTLRGLEGGASAIYFSVFDVIINEQKTDFRFHGRSRRPPLDRTNALLSFGYTLIHNECAAALESVGLDASAGFLHEDQPGRKSLACDLMEEFRSSVVDRFVLSMINRKIIHPDQFETGNNHGVYLNQSGRRTFLHHWQLNKKEQLFHPVLNENVSLGLLPYAQATLLAKAIRGEVAEYVPFFRR